MNDCCESQKENTSQDTILMLLNATAIIISARTGIREETLSHLVSTHSVAMAHLSEGTACWLSELCTPLQFSS